jgi:uncharacterized protein YbjT (DUF2867 family)
LIILLTGASGFIGRRLANALVEAGHEVVCAMRNPGRADDGRFRTLACDFTSDFDASVWVPRLAGIDAVINAVGILRERGSQTFDALHSKAPRALFAACVEAQVRRVVQISALGADEQAQSRYHLSKKEADDFLASLPLRSAIAQPSLVYGAGGASAKLFTMLASLPLIALPGGGKQMIQPVHVDDVVAALLALLDSDLPAGMRVPLVGSQPISLRAFLASLRAQLGLGRGCFAAVPITLARLGAHASAVLPGALLDPETLQMLERGNTADPTAIRALLGRAPIPVSEFVPQQGAVSVRLQAQLSWLLPIVRCSIAAVWIFTGIVSLGLYPVADSYALLARVGVTGMLAAPMLYGAAVLDVLFGIGTLVLARRWRHWLWLMQIATILCYTALITWRLPEFWLHPYGPLLKNLPMLAAIWLLFEIEKTTEKK